MVWFTDQTSSQTIVVASVMQGFGLGLVFVKYVRLRSVGRDCAAFAERQRGNDFKLLMYLTLVRVKAGWRPGTVPAQQPGRYVLVEVQTSRKLTKAILFARAVLRNRSGSGSSVPGSDGNQARAVSRKTSRKGQISCAGISQPYRIGALETRSHLHHDQ
jgi:hypothetical protein